MGHCFEINEVDLNVAEERCTEGCFTSPTENNTTTPSLKPHSTTQPQLPADTTTSTTTITTSSSSNDDCSDVTTGSTCDDSSSNNNSNSSSQLPSATESEKEPAPQVLAALPAPIYTRLVAQNSSTFDELICRVVSYLPPRLQGPWYNFHFNLMNGSGPLPHTWRPYIALLALCRHEVSWMCTLMAQQFLQMGGPRLWLKSYTEAPVKLQQIMDLNSLLAHQPWSVTVKHIQSLCGRNSSSSNEEGTWSHNEVLHAVLIMSHHHALSSFILSVPFLNAHTPPYQDPTTSATSPKRPPHDKKSKEGTDSEDEEEEDKDPSDSSSCNVSNNNISSTSLKTVSNSCSNSLLSSSPSRNNSSSLLVAAAIRATATVAASVAGTSNSSPATTQDSCSAKVAKIGYDNSDVSSRPASPVPPATGAPVGSSSAVLPPTAASPAIRTAPSSDVKSVPPSAVPATLPLNASNTAPTGGTQSSSSSLSSSPSSTTSTSSSALTVGGAYPGLLKDRDLCYKHFPYHLPDDDSPSIRGNVFSWMDCGFDMTRRLLGEDLTNLLDERLRASTAMGHLLDCRGRVINTSNKNNTPAIRRASGSSCHKPVWRQVQWLCGILYDGYNYKQLRRDMPHYMQKLIRTATCFPHKLSGRTPLTQQEAVGVCELIMEARVESEIMFGVRALMDYCVYRRSS